MQVFYKIYLLTIIQTYLVGFAELLRCSLDRIDYIYSMEIFKQVENFESRFEISNWGNLKSINGKYGGQKIMLCFVGSSGYREATLRSKPLKRKVRIHTLVAEHFLIKPNIYRPCVNHKDGNKLNNNVNNLEWTTDAGNSEHAVKTGLLNIKGSKHPNAKLTESQVIKLRSLFPAHTKKQIAEMFNISPCQAKDIINRVNWKHI